MRFHEICLRHSLGLPDRYDSGPLTNNPVLAVLGLFQLDQVISWRPDRPCSDFVAVHSMDPTRLWIVGYFVTVRFPTMFVSPNFARWAQLHHEPHQTARDHREAA
jgi:hypothetical protein